MTTPVREVIDLKEVRDYVLAFLKKHPAADCKWVRDGALRPNDNYRHIHFSVAHRGVLTNDQGVREARERELEAVFDGLNKHLKPVHHYVLLDWPHDGTFKILVYIEGAHEAEALAKWKQRPVE
ncbi:hypothetical protein [Nannocystis pusilla]|uniref:Uncharacterized protein n=1 Tax=Nannocystis pusilla TaxID=889268 RepID=A0ABS7U4E3_9BACT|nr:hypothetical protein [Nannocystis pusilla]MBZ5715281.1 hypothetical protein [Nannocystis pusilla]